MCCNLRQCSTYPVHLTIHKEPVWPYFSKKVIRLSVDIYVHGYGGMFLPICAPSCPSELGQGLLQRDHLLELACKASTVGRVLNT